MEEWITSAWIHNKESTLSSKNGIASEGMCQLTRARVIRIPHYRRYNDFDSRQRHHMMQGSRKASTWCNYCRRRSRDILLSSLRSSNAGVYRARPKALSWRLRIKPCRRIWVFLTLKYLSDNRNDDDCLPCASLLRLIAGLQSKISFPPTRH